MEFRIQKILGIITGILLIRFGYQLIQSPQIERTVSGYVIDTSGYNVPLGISVVILGALLIYVSIKSKKSCNKKRQ